MAQVNMTDIQDLIADQLGVDEAKPKDRIVEDLGAESRDITNIVAAVEDRYQITVDDQKIATLHTVQDVYLAVQKA